MGREEEENTQADQMPALWTLQNMGEDMTDEEFNRYCAEVMGYRTFKEINYICIKVPNDNFNHPLDDMIKYSPATILYQMAEVFDKLWPDSMEERSSLITDINEEVFLENLACKGIAQAMREFIESTKGESE